MYWKKEIRVAREGILALLQRNISRRFSFGGVACLNWRAFKTCCLRVASCVAMKCHKDDLRVVTLSVTSSTSDSKSCYNCKLLDCGKDCCETFLDGSAAEGYTACPHGKKFNGEGNVAVLF